MITQLQLNKYYYYYKRSDSKPIPFSMLACHTMRASWSTRKLRMCPKTCRGEKKHYVKWNSLLNWINSINQIALFTEMIWNIFCGWHALWCRETAVYIQRGSVLFHKKIIDKAGIRGSKFHNNYLQRNYQNTEINNNLWNDLCLLGWIHRINANCRHKMLHFLSVNTCTFP